MKILQYILAIIVVFGVSLLNAQTADGDSVQLNDGKKIHRYQIVEDTVIEFGAVKGKSDIDSEVKKADRNATVVKRGGRYRMWKMSKSGLTRSVSKKSRVTNVGKNCSLVLRNRSGQLMALPGNMIIAFNKDWDEEKVNEWADSRGLTVIRKMSHHNNSYLFKSPAGIKTLELANELAEDENITSVSPNWWMQMSTR